MCIIETQHYEVTVSHLHNAIPVVPGGYTEQQEESHAKILECCITAETFTGVQLITYWDRNKMSEVHTWKCANLHMFIMNKHIQHHTVCTML